MTPPTVGDRQEEEEGEEKEKEEGKRKRRGGETERRAKGEDTGIYIPVRAEWKYGDSCSVSTRTLTFDL